MEEPNNDYVLSLRKEMTEINKYIKHKNIKRGNCLDKVIFKTGMLDKDIIAAKRIIAEKKQRIDKMC